MNSAAHDQKLCTPSSRRGGRTPSTEMALQVRNPRTGEADYEIAITQPVQLAEIAQAARAKQVEWLAMGMAGRCAALLKFADALEAHQAAIAQALEIDTGRRKLALQEVLSVAGMLRGWAHKAPTMAAQFEWQAGRMKPECRHLNEHVPYSLIGIPTTPILRTALPLNRSSLPLNRSSLQVLFLLGISL